MGTQGSPVKSYDYLLKFLLVGDSDVGKGEILESLQDGAAESPYAYSNGIDYKTTTILLTDGVSSWNSGIHRARAGSAPSSGPIRGVHRESFWCMTSPIVGPLMALTGGSRKLMSMHLVFPGSWLGTGCTWPSSGKSQQSRPEPTQRRTA